MPHESPEINVQMFGRRWLRFILAKDDGTYWTGQGWTPHRRRALLYYHLRVVQKDRRRLIARQRRG
jgi:hypothetical protein